MNSTTPVTIVHTIAQRLGVRVKDCQVYDPNVCRFTIDAEHQWRPSVVSGYPFTQEIKLVHNGRRISVSASPEYVRITAEGELTVGVASINRANEVQFMEQTLLLVKDDARWPVFIPRESRPSSQLRSFLASPALHAAVEHLLEDKLHSLHVFQGAVVLYSRAFDADRLMDEIETLANLVSASGESV